MLVPLDVSEKAMDGLFTKLSDFSVSFSILFLSCESTLSPPIFDIYLCPVTDVHVSLKNTSTLDIQWTYPDDSIEGICDENVEAFIVRYLISDVPLKIKS